MSLLTVLLETWNESYRHLIASVPYTGQSFFYSSYSLVGTVSFETTNAMKLVAWHSDSWSTIVLQLTLEWPSAKYLIKTSKLAQSERNNHHSQYTSPTWRQFCQPSLDYKVKINSHSIAFRHNTTISDNYRTIRLHMFISDEKIHCTLLHEILYMVTLSIQNIKSLSVQKKWENHHTSS